MSKSRLDYTHIIFRSDRISSVYIVGCWLWVVTLFQIVRLESVILEECNIGGVWIRRV